ncbi:hypothetical protein QVD17_03956 [Tagetes erecta]|uniref:Uncharacterized protein n=1 Tax=Tagetes erecta TaxID=13708 RepID=A0AAD8P969_TARER|nr:hypothetical protein QVD17_03956 [Tagetes erecta]
MIELFVSDSQSVGCMNLQAREEYQLLGLPKLLANICYSYRGMGLSVWTMISGWDESVSNGAQRLDQAIWRRCWGTSLLILSGRTRCR